MRVLLSTTLFWSGCWYHSGDEVDLPDDLARKYIAAGSAEEVQPQVETAAIYTDRFKGKRDARNQATRSRS